MEFAEAINKYLSSREDEHTVITGTMLNIHEIINLEQTTLNLGEKAMTRSYKVATNSDSLRLTVY